MVALRKSEDGTHKVNSSIPLFNSIIDQEETNPGHKQKPKETHQL